MRRLALLAAVVAAALAAGPARGHGASKGLHIHLTPDRAAPGMKVAVAVDAALPMARLTIGWAGSPPTTVAPKTPARHLETTLVVPSGAAGTTVNVQAEAEAGGAKPLRASAILTRTP